MATTKTTAEIYREVGDEELIITVGLQVTSGSRATRIDPEEPPEIDVLWARDQADNEVELTDEEEKDLTRGEGAIDVFDALGDAEEAAAEDAWEAQCDR